MRLLVLKVVAGIFSKPRQSTDDHYWLSRWSLIKHGPFSGVPTMLAALPAMTAWWLPQGPSDLLQQGAWPVPRCALCLQTVLFIHSFLSSTNLLLAPSVKWQKSLWRTQQVPVPGSRPPDPEVEPPRRLLRHSQTDAFLSRTEALGLLASLNLGVIFLLGVKQYTAIWKYTQACTWDGKVNTNKAKGDKRIRQKV